MSARPLFDRFDFHQLGRIRDGRCPECNCDEWLTKAQHHAGCKFDLHDGDDPCGADPSDGDLLDLYLGLNAEPLENFGNKHLVLTNAVIAELVRRRLAALEAKR